MKTNAQKEVEAHVANELRDRINTDLRDAMFKDITGLSIYVVARRINAAGSFSDQFEITPEFTWSRKRR